MLPLDSDRWSLLDCCGDPIDVPEYLAEYYAGKIPDRDQLYEDLLILACGGEVFTSGYAAAPHLTKIAESVDPHSAVIMLVFAARLMGMASSPTSPKIIPELEAAFPAARLKGLELACFHLPRLPEDCPEREWLGVSILAFMGFDAAYREAYSVICAQSNGID